MEGYRWVKEEDRAAVFVREQWECLELYLGLEEEPGENLYVRISGQLILGDVVSVCYRPPEQEEEAGALFRPHVCRLLSLWQILTSMISPGGKIQQDTNNEGDFWSALMTAS